jgi:hypothetical protein
VIRRSQLPSLLVLSAALVAGAAAFVLVGRMAGLLYGGAALVLGLIVHHKLARDKAAADHGPEEPLRDVVAAQPEQAPAPKPSRFSRRRTGRRRRALEAELGSVQAALAEREAANAELARRLDDQHERTRALQATFAERVNELTEAAQSYRSELAAAVAAHESRVAAFEAMLAESRGALAQRETVVDELRAELDGRRAAEQLLADEVARLKAARRQEEAQLAWTWRTHVEEIAALESAVDAVLRSA